jgi:hypothetical protein
MLDRQDRPYLADFGLALRESEYRKKGDTAGTIRPDLASRFTATREPREKLSLAFALANFGQVEANRQESGARPEVPATAGVAVAIIAEQRKLPG